MATRKPISTRKRFEVFKRDHFTCQYCGKKPPETVLHVDHIVPVSKGGVNDESNLVTSCIDCNLGKSNVPLDSIPESLQSIAERKKEAAKQLKAYVKACKEEAESRNLISDTVEEVYSNHFEDYVLTGAARNSIMNFHKSLSLTDLIEAMEIAVMRVEDDPNDCFKYFCGICHNKIRLNND